MYLCILFVYISTRLPCDICVHSPPFFLISPLFISPPPLSTVLTIAVANKHPVITLPTDHIKKYSPVHMA